MLLLSIRLLPNFTVDKFPSHQTYTDSLVGNHIPRTLSSSGEYLLQARPRRRLSPSAGLVLLPDRSDVAASSKCQAHFTACTAPLCSNAEAA